VCTKDENIGTYLQTWDHRNISLWLPAVFSLKLMYFCLLVRRIMPSIEDRDFYISSFHFIRWEILCPSRDSRFQCSCFPTNAFAKWQAYFHWLISELRCSVQRHEFSQNLTSVCTLYVNVSHKSFTCSFLLLAGRYIPVEGDWNVLALAQRLDFVFQRKGPVHSNRRGCQVSQTLADKVYTSSRGDCIICSKYVDHSLEMSLKGGKKRVKRSGERDIILMCTNSWKLNLRWVLQSLF
jgi:hypothetical protein